MYILDWIRKNWYSFFHIVLLASQLLVAFWIGISAYEISVRNMEIQKALYDFETQLSGFVDDIWVHGFMDNTTATIELLIISPHVGNFTLEISNVYFFEQYLNSTLSWLNRISMIERVWDATYPQAYRYKADVHLEAVIFVKPELVLQYDFFKVGVVEFRLIYHDVPENVIYDKFFNGTVWFAFD